MLHFLTLNIIMIHNLLFVLVYLILLLLCTCVGVCLSVCECVCCECGCVWGFSTLKNLVLLKISTVFILCLSKTLQKSFIYFHNVHVILKE